MCEIDPIKSAVAAILPGVVETRHHLHRNPELSHQEKNTSALVASRLRDLGMDEVRTGVGGHGVIGALFGRGGSGVGAKTIALRADMDALPIQETNDSISYPSENPGVMHACGHDGHTATLLGVAQTLAGLRDHITGNVRFIFQPAEEVAGGAAKMCNEGAMEGVDAIVALHGWPELAVGQIGVRVGPMMASADTFTLKVHGRPAHAAMPHLSVDPIVIGSQIVLAWQTLVSRETSPTDSVVVTVAQFHAGTAFNIIPAVAEIKGTVRALTETIRREMPERLERIAAGICAAFRATYELHYHFGTPVTINDPEIVALVMETGRATLGDANVVTLPAPSMGAEDFAEYLSHAPGAMFRLGVGADAPPLHTPTYNFADGALPHGIEMLSRVALRYLGSSV